MTKIIAIKYDETAHIYSSLDNFIDECLMFGGDENFVEVFEIKKELTNFHEIVEECRKDAGI